MYVPLEGSFEPVFLSPVIQGAAAPIRYRYRLDEWGFVVVPEYEENSEERPVIFWRPENGSSWCEVDAPTGRVLMVALEGGLGVTPGHACDRLRKLLSGDAWGYRKGSAGANPYPHMREVLYGLGFAHTFPRQEYPSWLLALMFTNPRGYR